MSHHSLAKPTLSEILSDRNLKVAAVKVASYYRTQNYAGSPDAAMLEHLDPAMLREMVLGGAYAFQPIRPYFTRKKSGAVRMESVSSPLDRVVIQALFNRAGYQIQQGLILSASDGDGLAAPAYRFMSPRSKYVYSYWPAGYRAFRNRALRLARRHRRGFVLHADIQNFYPSINRDRIRTLLHPWFSEETWPLVDAYLDVRMTHGGMTEPLLAGLPIEEPVSRLLGNLYVEPLDHWVIHELKLPYCRYVDDLIFFVPNEHAARELRLRLEEYLWVCLGLALNAEKVETVPARELADGTEADFSRRLSILNANLALIPFQPALKKGLVGALKSLLQDCPPPPQDQPTSREDKLKARGVNFAAWRLARLKAVRYVDVIGSLLIDERFQRMAAIALAHLGTPKALKHLRTWLAEYGPSLSKHDQITVAAALARHGRLASFPMLEDFAARSPELMAVLRLRRATHCQLRAGLRDPDPLVRRACALHLAAKEQPPTGLRRAVWLALQTEPDRDTCLAFLFALQNYSGKAGASPLLDYMKQQKETIPCHP